MGRRELDTAVFEATLCFLLDGSPPARVLLGLKKVGFGRGKYGGAGGKLEPTETALRAAVRELEEETGILVLERDLSRMAHLTFLFPFRREWSQVVHVFTTASWTGDPVESREIVPVWFPVDGIPFGQMWADCRHWLPRVLEGQRTRARFVFNADNESIDEMLVEPWNGDL